MATRRLTETFVKGLRYKGKPVVYRDEAVVGLMVQVNRRGTVYKVQRDLWKGHKPHLNEKGTRLLPKTVRHTLGSAEGMTLDEARTRALVVIADIKRGIDPNKSAAPLGVRAWTVATMFEEYSRDMRTRGCQERTIKDMMGRLDFYLPEWKSTLITDIKRSAARDRHAVITREHGPRVANMAMKDFKWAYNFALKIMEDDDGLPTNPIQAVTMNRERASERLIMPEDLPDWWEKVGALNNPIRRAMHRLGLLSGLRPGTLASLRQHWIRLKEHVIAIPSMKSGRRFDLPLSPQMEELVRDAMQAANVLYPRAEWLFPTRSKEGVVMATQVWKESTLGSSGGHALRHTYRTLAKRLGINDTDARLLLDHTVPGIDGVYIHSRALFDRLLKQQERMSAYILMLTERQEQRKAAE